MPPKAAAESQDFAAVFFCTAKQAFRSWLGLVRALPGHAKTGLPSQAEDFYMLSQETLDEYRRMTPAQRFNLTLRAIRENIPYLDSGTPEQVVRRFELIRRENDLRNENMLKAMARLRDAE
jgi:hypothetical protein